MLTTSPHTDRHHYNSTECYDYIPTASIFRHLRYHNHMSTATSAAVLTVAQRWRGNTSTTRPGEQLAPLRGCGQPICGMRRSARTWRTYLRCYKPLPPTWSHALLVSLNGHRCTRGPGMLNDRTFMHSRYSRMKERLFAHPFVWGLNFTNAHMRICSFLAQGCIPGCPQLQGSGIADVFLIFPCLSCT